MKRRQLEAKYSNKFFVDIDRVTLDNEEIANHFNKVFINISANLSNSIDPCPGIKPIDLF